MSRASEYFLASRSDVVELELLDIAHPNASQAWRLVRNAPAGVTVTLEDGTTHAYQYVPMSVSSLGARENLDSGFHVQVGDLGEILPGEIDRIAAAGAFNVKPTVTYRAYRSDDLSAPIGGPYVLELGEFTFTRDGAAFDAKAPSLNTSGSGDVYSVTRFPMLRGFVS